MKSRFRLLVSLIALLIFCAPRLSAQPRLPIAPDLEALLKQANSNGKYGMLLLQVADGKAQGVLGDFADQGLQPSGPLADVIAPAGYRVYAAPYWFIWRDQRSAKRPWGPEQLIGEPDTPQAGDYQTAWASKSQDEQDEWLLLEYDAPFLASGVTIYETHNPGAVTKITAFGLDGREEEIWAGRDNPLQGALFINQKNFPRAFKTNRIKLYLDSKSVPGWNEIDAVGLTDKAGKTHWAMSAECSSTYADKNGGAVRGGGFIPANPDVDILKLLQQFRQMQNDINELRQKAGLPPRELPPFPNVAPQFDLFLGGLFEREVLNAENPTAK